MKFNVTASVNNVVNLAGIQLYMDFDDAVINFTRWFVPSPNIFTPKTTSALPTPPDGNYQHLVGKGKILLSLSLFPTPPTQPPVTGSGAVAIVEFVVKALPPKLGFLTSQLHINTADTYLLDDDGLEIACTKNDDTYTLTWKAPASPKMGFTPGNKIFGPDPPSVLGTTFTEDLVIKGLSAAWFLTTANFDVNYDSTIISIVNPATDVVFAAGWGGIAIVTEPPGILTIAANHASAPGPDEVVATVTFTIMKQGVAPAPDDVSPLTYANVFFFDHIGPIPAAASESATITIHALRTMDLPWLEVVPPTITLGPAPSIGTEFDVGVKITGPAPLYLDAGWTLIGVQFRLFYDDTLLEVVSVTEGPSCWIQPGTCTERSS
jgi:hypothetical protein